MGRPHQVTDRPHKLTDRPYKVLTDLIKIVYERSNFDTENTPYSDTNRKSGGKDVPTFQVGIRENLFTVNENLIYKLKCSGGWDIIGQSQFIYLFDG